MLENWKEEKRSAYLYYVMAEVEQDKTRKDLFKNLAIAAEQQAQIWEQQIKKSSGAIPEKYRPDFYARFIAILIKIFGIKRLRTVLSAMKIRGLSVYLESDPHYPYPSGAVEHERRHKSIGSGGNLRAAVFGINDGLLSNASLMLGVIGANVDYHYIILTGVAGLLAGACSMAAGEFVSVSSQRELYNYQIALEKKELELYPEEEAEELSIIYQARGLPKDEADKISHMLISNPESGLDTLAREELGINPAEISSPWGAAFSSFFSFTIGAFIPLIPFLFGGHDWNTELVIILTAVSLFSIGALMNLFTNKGVLLSGLRMLFIGIGTGAFTFFIGKLFAVSLQ